MCVVCPDGRVQWMATNLHIGFIIRLAEKYVWGLLYSTLVGAFYYICYICCESVINGYFDIEIVLTHFLRSVRAFIRS